MSRSDATLLHLEITPSNRSAADRLRLPLTGARAAPFRLQRNRVTSHCIAIRCCIALGVRLRPLLPAPWIWP